MSNVDKRVLVPPSYIEQSGSGSVTGSALVAPTSGPVGEIQCFISMDGYDLGSPQRVEIREGFGKHTVVMADFEWPRTTLKFGVPPELTAMKLDWGIQPTDVRTFYGYVNHHEILDEFHAMKRSFARVRVFCVGTSLLMNQPSTRSWTSVTPSYVCRLLARQYGMRSVIHQSKYVESYIGQGTLSDFALLKKLADDTGFKLWVDGSTLQFLNPEVLISTPQATFVPSFTMNRIDGITDSLKKVKVIAGSLAPRDQDSSVVNVFGIDMNTNVPIKLTGAQTFETYSMTAPTRTVVHPNGVSSLEEARKVIEAAVWNNVWAEMRADVSPVSNLRPGDICNIGGTALHPDYQGIWLVNGATHVMSRWSPFGYGMTSELDLTRNQQDRSKFQLKSGLIGVRKVVPCVTQNGVWKAQAMEDVIV